ncbi:MAG: SDR family NAD(P)-dependent oxidoreductase [Thermoanaerobaculia bacterium]
MSNRVALITGSYRGLGLATAAALALKDLDVIVTARDAAKVEMALRALFGRGKVRGEILDVDDAASIEKLRQRVGDVDVLVNNAAVYLDESESVLDVDIDLARRTFETNVLGPLRLMQLFVPGMMRRRWGRVVNVSSGAGQLSSMRDYAPSYSASKAALNAMTRMVADAAKGTGVLVNAVDPGWVRTEMGGSNAPRSIEEGIDTIVWLATLPDGGPTGKFFHDRREIAW